MRTSLLKNSMLDFGVVGNFVQVVCKGGVAVENAESGTKMHTQTPINGRPSSKRYRCHVCSLALERPSALKVRLFS